MFHFFICTAARDHIIFPVKPKCLHLCSKTLKSAVRQITEYVFLRNSVKINDIPSAHLIEIFYTALCSASKSCSYLSYTYTRTKNRTTGEVYPTIAPNALALWQKYRIDGGLLNGTVLGLGYRCKDSYYATFRGAKIADNYTIPSYSVFDFTVEIPLPESKWLKDATLRLAVYNIFDKKYVQSTRHAVQCTVGEPRTFEVGLKTTF